MLRDIPYSFLVDIVEILRDNFYTIPWDEEADSIVLDAGPDEIEYWFRQYRHAEGMLLCYKYKGEDLNLRIPWGLDEDGDQMEFHFRGREKALGTELIAHFEKSRYEEKDDHINMVGFSREKGIKILMDIIEGSPFEVVRKDIK